MPDPAATDATRVLRLAAIGTVSMVFFWQTAKNVRRCEVGSSVGVFASCYRRQRTKAQDPLPLRRAPRQPRDLIVLAMSGDQEAFYNLPIEDLCVRIRNAVPVILDYPHMHEDLSCCLASQASADDIRCLLQPPAPETFLKRGDESSNDEKHALREYAAAKTRLAAQVCCSIDAIETSIGFR